MQAILTGGGPVAKVTPVTHALVNPPELAAPSGFSHAVVATGARIVFLAGQTGTTADGAVVPGGVVPQFERALANLVTVLAASGGRSEHLASVTVYAVDLDDYRAHSAELGEVWRRLVGRVYPAMAVVGVTRLWDPAAVVELQGYAVLG